LRRPGTASDFTPREGRAHAWITSAEVTRTRVLAFVGTRVRLSTSSRRNPVEGRSLVGIM
jgi:hypothetical protein